MDSSSFPALTHVNIARRTRSCTQEGSVLNIEPYLIEAAEAARALESDLERGLTSEEAARRLARDGPNELRKLAKRALGSAP